MGFTAPQNSAARLVAVSPTPSRSHWLRRDQAASSRFIEARLWRGCADAAFGTRLPARNAIDIVITVLGRCLLRRGRFFLILLVYVFIRLSVRPARRGRGPKLWGARG
jgi:hypothetical protein